MSGMGVGFVVPVIVSSFTYGVIWYRARQSTRRIGAREADRTTASMPNAKCEIKLVRNMLMLLSVFVSGGSPFVFLVLWQKIASQTPPPESFYLLAVNVNAISLCVMVMMTVLFYMNKQVKSAVLAYFNSQRHRDHPPLMQRSTLPCTKN
ncbi:unnamed protein product [Rotaria sp. Silwood1]|nr:unnamed protein product [Rotaria sp. Silwood1]CAF1603761.1 unnamed protein product [Rotaria sp. Silwood1]CAF1604591.1 unnamed protein product [Rotaria sp. Silwood1]CAF3723088.1 unnamed protein product [Rotaria sp. Silwood1]CAF3748342.1 unnamed protein product [Rotaria sp. Silwood1]